MGDESVAEVAAISDESAVDKLLQQEASTSKDASSPNGTHGYPDGSLVATLRKQSVFPVAPQAPCCIVVALS